MYSKIFTHALPLSATGGVRPSPACTQSLSRFIVRVHVASVLQSDRVKVFLVQPQWRASGTRRLGSHSWPEIDWQSRPRQGGDANLNGDCGGWQPQGGGCCGGRGCGTKNVAAVWCLKSFFGLVGAVFRD